MDVYISTFKEDGARIFTDRDKGVAARVALDLDNYEMKENITVKIPTDTWGINPSFFGGLFETSIKRFKEDFFDKYTFEYTNGEKLRESLKKDIEDNFDYVMACIE